MAKEEEEVPAILVLASPFGIDLKAQNPPKYRFLEAFSSNLPLLQFLQQQQTLPPSVRAIICNALKPVTADVIRSLPSLDLVVTASAGTDHIDLTECRRRRIQVVNIGGLFAADVADMAVALLIDVLFKISAGDRFARNWGLSKPLGFPFGSKLGGKRVGIIGLGRIGGEVAKRLEAFDCIIKYHSRNKNPSVSYTFYSNVVDLASNSDVLVLCCPLTEQTRHIINKEVMLALGKDGIIINVGRGALIDEKELVQCLVKGEIRGAGLDVFEDEPNVPKELFPLDNVVLSPHAAALTLDGFKDSCDYVTKSLDTFFSIKPQVSKTKLTCD
ncbi:glyoxylate/hydroxypyruvate reductase HPR3 [Arachis duranensis]|uniref:glyoxylate reductase (NADP(+)) n=1 Tax=Arachis duranensis TaxID=130453 RepID=A0A6P4BF06_ARADU|nr:glyoxylate/hydroxypyruvate reductase HPR3 [Arachis duranensis]